MEASRVPPSPDPQLLEPTGGSALARLIRHWAEHRDPEERRRDIALLMAARVEEVEERIGPMLARPLREHGLEPLARRVERDPLATLVGALLAGWIARRLFRD